MIYAYEIEIYYIIYIVLDYINFINQRMRVCIYFL